MKDFKDITEEELAIMKDKDYGYLEGKDIDWLYPDTGNLVLATTGPIDYDIGITIKDQYDKEQYLTCIHGAGVQRNSRYKETNYDETFYLAVQMIESGTYDARVIRRLSNKERGIEGLCVMGTLGSCAFG